MSMKVQIGIEFEAIDPLKAQSITDWIQYALNDTYQQGYITRPAEIVANKKDVPSRANRIRD